MKLVPGWNRGRLLLAIGSTLAVVLALGGMWWSSLLPDTYDLADMGTPTPVENRAQRFRDGGDPSSPGGAGQDVEVTQKAPRPPFWHCQSTSAAWRSNPAVPLFGKAFNPAQVKSVCSPMHEGTRDNSPSTCLWTKGPRGPWVRS